MSEVFMKLLNLSITAGWLILAVVIIRPLLKKAPRWISCVLWALVALRLVCPFSFESAWSLIPSNEPIPYEIAMQPSPSIHTGLSVIDQAMNPIMVNSFSPNQTDSANPLQLLISVAVVIWLAGMAALLLYALISYLKLKKSVGASIAIKDHIMICDEVTSPFILGILKPVIYLPSSISGETLDCVLKHETAHLRRHDHWWKPLGYLLLTVYWFNPLCWLAYRLLCRDIELACDEKVIRSMSRSEKAAYSQALLDCSFHRTKVAACPVAFGEVGVKERVKTVLSYKKPAFWIVVVAVIACLVIAVCFLTDPKGTSESQSDAATRSFDMEDGVSASIAAQLAGHPSSASFTAKPLPMDSESVLSSLSSVPVEALAREFNEYPDNMGSTEVLYCGEPPFYDLWLNVETVPTDSRICFKNQSYSFLSAVFEPRQDSAHLRGDDLSFARMNEAKEMVAAVADRCGFRMTALTGGSLSADTLQSLYDQRKQNGTLRENRYGTDGSATKNESAIADHPAWTKEDECYYLHGQAAFADIPIWGSEVDAYVNSDGILCFSAYGLLQPTEQTKTAELQSSAVLLDALDQIAANIYSDSKPILRNAQLQYHSEDGVFYVPAWLFTLDYTFVDPEGMEEERSVKVWINACTAEEIIEKEIL